MTDLREKIADTRYAGTTIGVGVATILAALGIDTTLPTR